jgi:transcriptional regulator CtsR
MLSKSIGGSINKESAFVLIEALHKQKLIDLKIVNVLKALTDDSTLIMVDKPYRDKLRAELLKAVIVAALIE